MCKLNIVPYKEKAPDYKNLNITKFRKQLKSALINRVPILNVKFLIWLKAFKMKIQLKKLHQQHYGTSLYSTVHKLTQEILNFSIAAKTISFWDVCTNVDPNLIADQHNFRAKYLQDGEKKAERKSRSISF